MYTTLAKLQSSQVLTPIQTTLKSIYGPNDKITPRQIAAATSINDTLWTLKAFNYLDYLPFTAELAAYELPFKDPTVNVPLLQLVAYHLGQRNGPELVKLTAKPLPTSLITVVIKRLTSRDPYQAHHIASILRAQYGNADRDIEQLFIKHFGE
jgi:hypothetical protein